MGWCPHCQQEYDEDNETQPCCYSCGHPIACGGDCPDHQTDDPIEVYDQESDSGPIICCVESLGLKVLDVLGEALASRGVPLYASDYSLTESVLFDGFMRGRRLDESRPAAEILRIARAILVLPWRNRIPERLLNHLSTFGPKVVVAAESRRQLEGDFSSMVTQPLVVELNERELYGSIRTGGDSNLVDLLVLLATSSAPEILIDAPSVASVEVLGRCWDSILHQLELDFGGVYSMDPRAFEELIAELLEREKFRVELTQPKRDGGRDVLAYQDGPLGNHLHYVECKRFAPDRKVDVGLVRALYGVTVRDRATSAALITTSGFTKPATEFAVEIPRALTLRDGAYLSDWIKRLRGSENFP